jgi:hypothetical protein
MRSAFVALFVLFFSAGNAISQDISTLMDGYDKKVPKEKIYIQFDNNIYTPGQTIWYKAYLQHDNKPSAISSNLYLDWYDQKGNLLQHIVAPVINSSAIGSYGIPANFNGKNLRVLAYTRWMLNFDSSFLFQKEFTVISKNSTEKNSTEKQTIPTVTLGFYPEGGELVENIPSVIAFKAINSAGMPVSVSGVIMDSEKKTVADFTTVHNGMGKFGFTPMAGNKYVAEWKDPQGVMQHTLLPVAKPSGVVLTVNNTSSSPSITLERSSKPESLFGRFTIVATMNQQVLFQGVANLTNQSKIQAGIPSDKFPSGVMLLTVFDALKKPVAERILFINNDEYRTDISLTVDTLGLDKRSKNVYNIKLPDTLIASLSLSVTDGEEHHDKSSDILSQLLLSSEIRGKIFNPSYYFSSAEDSVAAQLDLVMLTNGWRKFLWEEVLANKAPSLRYQPDTGFLSLEGNITRLKEEKRLKAEFMNLLLISKDSSKQFLFAPIEPDGSFKEENLVLYDTTTVYFRMNNSTNIPWRSKITIKNSFDKLDTVVRLNALNNWLPDTTGTARIQAIAAEQKRLEELKGKTTLKEVIVHSRAKNRMQELDERHTSGSFKNASDSYNFNVLDDKSAQTFGDVFTYIQGRIPGVTVRTTGAMGTVKVVRVALHSLKGGETVVPVYLDESYINDPTTLKGIPMTAIAYIKSIPPPFVGEWGGGQGGALAIYTISGDDIPELIKNTPSQNLDKASLVGYTPVKAFYSPNYAEEHPNMDEKDLRRTLLWKPDIQAEGGNNKIRISFYNNDFSKSLQCILEGVTSDGKLVHLVQKITGTD